MTQKERNEITKLASGLTNEQLEVACYDAIYDACDSQVDAMVEQDYDLADIMERRKYEKYLGQKAAIIESIAEQRGIELFVRRKESR